MIKLIQQDITGLDVDAIVNAANARLVMGGGVAGAILKKGGDVIQKECDKIGGTYVGGAVITSAGQLKAGFVIHAVGPRMGDSNGDEELKNATLNSLKIAYDKKLCRIAFPAISTGIFGYPKDRCASIMIPVALEFLKDHDMPREVIFCLYDNETHEIFQKELKKHL